MWGDYLFHYTSAPAIAGIISTRKIWATDSQYLNDGLEGRLLEARLINMVSAPNVHFGKEFPEKHLEALRLHLRRGRLYHVASFSKRPDMLTQFRMYCPAAGGFVIGFPREYLSRVGRLVDVEYDRTHHDSWCGQFFMKFMEAADKADNASKTAAEVEYDIAASGNWVDVRCDAAIECKSNEFASEEEVRLLHTGARATHVRPSRQGNLFVPYVELELPNEALLVQVAAGPGRFRELAHASIPNLLKVAECAGTKWQFGQLGIREFGYRDFGE